MQGFEVDVDRAEALIERYLESGPRYTSYPTVPAWGPYGPEEFRADLEAAAAQRGAPLSLYVHVPFCRSLCHFCACNRVITRKPELPARYLEVIEREVASLREALGGERPVIQHHWGGGTPTHLTPEQVRRLFRTVTDAFPLGEDAEVSIEVDPRVTSEAHLEVLRECGFQRISLGVQDFDPTVQEAVHRIQAIDDTARLVESARRLGFESVNFDLIYGLPFQREASFARTLDTVMALSPDRVALYSYAHVTWKAKQQRGFERKDIPDARTKLRIFVLAVQRFLAAGYVFIGLDHFARPEDELVEAWGEGTLRRNFMGYTTRAGTDLVGFGPSAISELSESYAQSRPDLAAWEEAVLSAGLATFRGCRLSEDDRARRWVIERIMCYGGVRAEDYRAAFGDELGRAYVRELERLAPLEADGLVVRSSDGSFELTPFGRLFMRNVAMVFDAYLPEQRQTGAQLFSKTV